MSKRTLNEYCVATKPAKRSGQEQGHPTTNTTVQPDDSSSDLATTSRAPKAHLPATTISSTPATTSGIEASCDIGTVNWRILTDAEKVKDSQHPGVAPTRLPVAV